ncbi:hypothetical protein LTR08_004907 [Meristemomyces frigidus]|nr:hypothetical protein LTR08_004907 [Meristemomyces frigidus]
MVMRPAQDPAAKQAARSNRDPNTLSNYNAWRTKHTMADFDIDFDAKCLRGTVHLIMERVGKGAGEVVLDTSYLNVSSVRANNTDLQYSLAASRTEPYGTPLTITIPDSTNSTISATSPLALSIAVQTTKDCTALQWLTPAQTSNRKHPYMFSQCQAIHARSLFPCQDTPDVKSTYTFNIRSPLPVLASGLLTTADKPDGNPDSAVLNATSTKLYTFEQKIPMPSYLFALASGDIASAPIGPRSTVWTSPDKLAAAQWEFERDTETYIQEAEKIVYPYAWGQYNVLVLPPSFPYGGMENPVMTFATPTVVSGDRQNVDVIAHELSHSWSGNLVSNASWEHFWLNEGWTTYLERRLQAAKHVADGGKADDGDKYRDFSALIGWKALEDSIVQFGEGHEFTKLVPDLEGKDPDEAFSSIPYEKGFVFLYALEKLVGKEKWDTFIPHYFQTWRERSLDSYEFKATLLAYFENDAEVSKKLARIDWDETFYKPGFPPKPAFDTTLADECYALASKWTKLSTKEDSSSSFTPSAKDIKDFTANQSVVFLETLQQSPHTLSPDLIDLLGSTYAFAQSENVELVSRFLALGLQSKAPSVYQPTAELLGKVGRMKFVRPLYRGLMGCDMGLARKTFDGNREFYHPICRGMVERLFEKHADDGTRV